MIYKNVVNILHFWNVPSEVVGRIEGLNYVRNKEKHNEYLLFHPFVAKIALLILLESIANISVYFFYSFSLNYFDYM